MSKPYQPKTGARCHCKRGVQRDNCPNCEGTGMVIDFKAIRERTTEPAQPAPGTWHASTTNKGSAHEQGLVIDENTGANIAVTYDAKHARIIAAAPELLAAVEHVLIASEDGGNMNDIDFNLLRAAIEKATT